MRLRFTGFRASDGGRQNAAGKGAYAYLLAVYSVNNLFVLAPNLARGRLNDL